MPAEILTDAFFDSFDSTLVGLDAAETLPPACYTDASFYEFEKEALFNHEWLCVGRADWVKAPGDYFTTQIVGEPIVVSHARDGVIRAMSSVCQHRAMLVAEGKGNARGFVCPYHHWVYGLDGKLVNAPAMERTCDFDKKTVRLPEFKVEIWLGFIFINFDADAAPLAPRLATVADAVAGYDLANAADALPLITGQFATSCTTARCTTSSRASWPPSPTPIPPTPASCATTAPCTPTPASTRPRRRCCRSSPS